MKTDMVNLPDLFTVFWMSHCYNFGEESKNPLRGQKKHKKCKQYCVYKYFFDNHYVR